MADAVDPALGADRGKTGCDFEMHGLVLEGALHDPSGAEGAVIYAGSKRNAIFMGHEEMHACEDFFE